MLRHQPHHGRGTVASCVVFDADGPVRSAVPPLQHRGHRRRATTTRAMHQALERRFRRAIEEGGVLPDVLLIDGGDGPARAGAARCWRELGVEGVRVVGVAKGEERRAGPRDPDAARRPRTAPRRGIARLAADPAGARRGAPFRDHRPPRPPPEGARTQPAGGHPGHRPAPPREPAQAFRRTGRAEAGRGSRKSRGRGHQRRPGRTNLCYAARAAMPATARRTGSSDATHEVDHPDHADPARGSC